jgi:hypothetical protein
VESKPDVELLKLVVAGFASLQGLQAKNRSDPIGPSPWPLSDRPSPVNVNEEVKKPAVNCPPVT